MEAVQGLAPHQQKLFMKEMEQLQLKDSLTYVALKHRTPMLFCDLCTHLINFPFLLRSIMSFSPLYGGF